ncbi:SAM-dependent methyltransferase [Clostridium sp.]|uniref:SAM-dependent methyltransferase n=1 Tax=Clostridium sp. TaxID=1506 RepID=UPI003F348CB5
MTEQEFEKLLNIKTCGEQKGFNESLHYNRYEATSYLALETLFNNYKISEKDSIIDYGCGKGRLNFYANYFYNSTVTGIEMNTYYYKEALDNKEAFISKHRKDSTKINFINSFAEKSPISKEDNIFYFFNPFSVQIFIKVIENILDSAYEHGKTVDIVLYYPSHDYIYYLENNTSFDLIKEIPISSLYSKDNRQVFLIYRFSLYN